MVEYLKINLHLGRFLYRCSVCCVVPHVSCTIGVNWCNCKGIVSAHSASQPEDEAFLPKNSNEHEDFVYIDEISHMCMWFYEKKFKAAKNVNCYFILWFSILCIALKKLGLLKNWMRKFLIYIWGLLFIYSEILFQMFHAVG